MDMTTIFKDFTTLSTLILIVTQVWKETINNNNTQRASVLFAILLTLVTGTSILQPLGFVPANNFVDLVKELQLGYDILFYIADVLVTSLLASKGSNVVVDLFNKKNTIVIKKEEIQ